ncbi:trehalose 6-phosphate phosphatase [Citricoccus zhacaiensis]|uniref:Trehalose 6-phosphate phosphatase n=1 Tax=Citricoccus zhacaiensis TaxID=489142 RepID=A0ABQ2LQ61_9MICC|nr:trehalose-phosphatase [Citricoccus zhacaiensis]GGO41925.1 trehalose 6-phosphate phosphatase [Citricoccus zhacaiensis]
MTGPGLATALQEFAARDSILVALDFDGVMAELVDRAENARPLPANATALAALAELPGVHTALVSGRALASLTAVAAPPERTLLIGSHGAERRLGPEAPPLELDEEQTRTLAAVGQVLEPVAAQYPDSWVESKPAARVLQVRLARSDEARRRAVAEAEEALGKLDGLAPVYIGHGKDVLEVAVVRADKGQGLDLLRSVTGAEAVLFAGDDVTDETGFARLDPARDVSIKVGPGETRAQFRIEGPADVATVLEAVRSWRQ